MAVSGVASLQLFAIFDDCCGREGLATNLFLTGLLAATISKKVIIIPQFNVFT